jgi:hypothetical protein
MNLLGLLTRLAAITIAVSPAVAFAQDATIKAFTSCDASFFSHLYNERLVWGAASPKFRSNAKNRTASYAVKSRETEGENRVEFAKPVKSLGVEWIGFFDEADKFTNDIHIYRWGFLAEGNIDEIATIVQSKTGLRLTKLSENYVRSELSSDESRWAVLPAALLDGKVPMKGTVERVLILSKDTKTDAVSFECSLQGTVTAKSLSKLRPDMPQSHYLTRINLPAFEAMIVPSSVFEALKSERLASLRKPKFRSVSFIRELALSDGTKSQSKVTLLEDAGLVTRLVDSDFESLRTLTVANLAEIKSRDQSQYYEGGFVSEAIEYAGANDLFAADVFTLKTIGKSFDKDGEKPSEAVLRCKAKETSNASTINPVLTGRMRVFLCKYNNSIDLETAYVEDLGIFLSLSSAGRREIYTDLKIER